MAWEGLGWPSVATVAAQRADTLKYNSVDLYNSSLQLHWGKWLARRVMGGLNCLPARSLAADAIVRTCLRARVARTCGT
eukprot:362746-Pleurochrysis_carterae.AAC.4